MKRFLATLLLCCASLSIAPVVFADEDTKKEAQIEAKTKDTDSFNVGEVFEIDGPNGSFSLTNDLIGADRTSEDVKYGPVTALILKAINILSLLVGTFAFIMIVIGGFFFMAATEESRIDKGKAILTQAIVGLVIAFLSYMIIAAIESLLA